MAYASRKTTTVPEFVGSEFPGFLELSKVHKDSWGLAYSAVTKFEVEKKPITAALDEDFPVALDSHPSTGALLHFRWASPGLGVTVNNAHPFVHDDLSLIHNGAITPYDSLAPLVAPEFLQLRRGTTDSELSFLFLLTNIKKNGFLVGVEETIATIRHSFAYSSINTMIMNSDYLIVISEHDPKNKPEWADEFYYELRYRIDRDGIAVASSGWRQDGWELMPNHSILIYDRRDFTFTLRSL